MDLKVGADPEIFLYSLTKRSYISAHNLVPGDKKHPHKLEKGAVQRDGTAAEINIDPASTPAEFVENIDTVLAQLKKMLPDDVEMRFQPSIYYDQRYFDEEIPDTAKQLGCDPDYNAYSGRPNPVNPGRTTLRTAGGHIHLGWGSKLDPYDRAHVWDCREMTKRLWQYYRQFSYLFDQDKDRIRLYGLGACFRAKPYGVEFRSPSNAWLKDRRLWPWIFDMTQWTFNHAITKPNDFDTALAEHYRWQDRVIYDPATRRFINESGVTSVDDKMYQIFKDKSYPKFPLEVNNGTTLSESGGSKQVPQQHNLYLQR